MTLHEAIRCNSSNFTCYSKGWVFMTQWHTKNNFSLKMLHIGPLNVKFDLNEYVYLISKLTVYFTLNVLEKDNTHLSAIVSKIQVCLFLSCDKAIKVILKL